MNTRRQGFVLYDAVAALMLLSVMGFGAFSMYRSGMDYLRISSERETAVRALNNQWETLIATPASDLPTLNETEFVPAHIADVLIEPQADILVNESDGVYTVTLSIAWTSHTGRPLVERIVGLRSF